MGTKVKLSRIQEQLWLAERLGLHPSAYLVPMVLEIKGPIDEDALRSSIVDIVTRHQVLRTRFFEEDGELRGEVRPADEVLLETEYCSRADLLDRGGLAAVLAAHSETPIDVSESIPIRAKLVRIADGDHVLSLVLHHLAFDDWSRNQFYTELAERYRSHMAGPGTPLPRLVQQYHEYAVRRDELNASTREMSLTYWQRVLEGLDPFEIAPDHPRSPRRRGRGAATGFEISSELASAISQIANACGASKAMVLFAAVQMTLYRFTGSDDISFGTTIAARDDDESQELIGPLVNTLVLRGDVSGDPSFAELVDRMRDTLLDGIEHSGIPFNELVAQYGAVADLSRNPLTQVMVQYGSGVRRRPELEGCKVVELSTPATGSKYDLVILFDEIDDGRLTVDIGWDSDLYLAETITSLADSLQTAINDVALLPERRLRAVRMLTPRAESETLVLQRGARHEPDGMSLHELFGVQVRTRPDAVAIVSGDGRSCSYGELDSMASSVASTLSRSGIGPESIVAIHAPRSLSQVVAILGVLKAGAAYLALDPDYPAERTRYMLEDSQASVILFEEELAPELQQIVPAALRIASMHEQPGEVEPRYAWAVHQDAACALIYTSGSTGRPKGVLLTHRGLAGRLVDLQRDFPLEHADRVLVKASCAFDMSITELFWPLIAGAVAVLARPGGHRDPSYLMDRIEQAGVTVASFVPSVLAVMAGDSKLKRCTSLRMVTAGGEELRRTVVKQLRERLPACDVYNGYGPTETSVYTSWHSCGTEVGGGPAIEPLGSPLPNTHMYVLDEWQTPVPPGGVGELYIGGPGVARGYVGRPGVTAERFVPDPFATGERLYRTGDLVRYSPAARSYRFLGRTDLQVKIGGVRVELGEVEALLASHDVVAQCAVVVETVGEIGQRVSAFITASREVDSDELLAHARIWLPPSAVPSNVTVLEALPVLPNGKVDRLRLLEMSAGTAPTARSEVLGGHQAVLAEIWREVLGVADITTTSHFFLSGGHSLLAIQMTNRTRERLDMDVPLSLIFEAPVFDDYSARLAELIQAEG